LLPAGGASGQPAAQLSCDNDMRTDEGPTPETKAKCESAPYDGDYLRWLYLTGGITDIHWDAALDIRRALEYIWSINGMRISDLERGTDHSKYKWADDKPAPKCVNRYNDWIDSMGKRKYPAGPVLDAITHESYRCTPKGIVLALELYPPIPIYAFSDAMDNA